MKKFRRNFSADGRDTGSFPPLIEIARTVCKEGHLPPLQAAIKGRDVMLTIAITIAWLSVAVILFMAAKDTPKRWN